AALADVAWTLQTGRRAFGYRRAAVVTGHDDAVRVLGEGAAPERVASGGPSAGGRAVAFLCSGQGGQYVGMGRELYHSQPVFRDEVDRCATLLAPRLGLDLRTVIAPRSEAAAAAARDALRNMGVAQVAVFTLEYALAR